MSMEEEWRELNKGNKYHTPTTVRNGAYNLRRWEKFLRERKVRLDRVSIEDFEAFEDQLIAEGKKLSTVSVMMSYVVMYYGMKANKEKGVRWFTLRDQMKAHKRPKMRASSKPHEKYPLKLIPDILDAARELGGEIYVLVAVLTMTGMRAQCYGLRVKELDFDNRIMNPIVKGAHQVTLPMHKDLAPILREHLDTRTYESEMVFRLGKPPYTFTEGGEAQADEIAIARNEQNVCRFLGKVEEVLRDRGIDVHLTAHRFRESLGTYASQYRHLTTPPLDDKDIRFLLSHEAETITQQYDQRDIIATRDKWDQMAYWRHEWVDMALNGGHVRIPNGENGDPLQALQSVRAEVVRKLDAHNRAMVEPLFDGLEKFLAVALQGA